MSTGYVIIQQGGHADRVATIPPEGLTIGRGEEAQLQLPNVSVSRLHARIRPEGRRYFLEDAGSGNGTVVNHEPLGGQPRELGSEDVITIGSFKLVFLVKTGRAFPSWRGQFVNQMQPYTVAGRQQGTDATFGLDKATLVRMAEADHRRDSARLIEQGTTGRAWQPGDRELIFGRNAQIPLPGWLTAARAARIRWVNGHHVIESLSWWTPSQLNGSPLTSPTRLSNGARLRIGKVLFRYEVPSSAHIRKMYEDKPTTGGRRETFSLPRKG